MEDTALQQATIDQEKYKDIYFRMNFYILKAIYIKLIERINATYPDVSLSSKEKDLFYKSIMGSNNTDYSKYMRGKSGKTKITSTMENQFKNKCPVLLKYLKNCELIKTGDITNEWARRVIIKSSKEIEKECIIQVTRLAENIVQRNRKKIEHTTLDDSDIICQYMLNCIINDYYNSQGSENKIEDALKAIETITIADIDRCSLDKLEQYHKRLRTKYFEFNKIFEYKKLTKK